LRVFENRVLRKIFGFERKEIRGWGRIHTEELYDLYSSGDHIKKNEMGEACARMGIGEVHTGFGGKT
jgi:hypothetical protein